MTPSGDVLRFTWWFRLQHALVILFFGLLLLTGLPQKWPESDISLWFIDHLGGIYLTRWLHRFVGWGFVGLLVAHLGTVILPLARRKGQPSMFMTRKDFTDTIQNLRYYLGYADSPARFGRYSYGQKFEYWGLVFGSLIMAGSGLILRYPVAISRVLPAELIPVAKVFHSNEAMLALLIVMIWHMYSAHLSPEVFPMDASIFTGRLSRERKQREHPLEEEPPATSR